MITGVTAGLVLGEFTGILLFCFVMVRLGIAKLPEGRTWKHMIAFLLKASKPIIDWQMFEMTRLRCF